MGIKRILERIVLSGALALAGCQSNAKTDSLKNKEYFGALTGDFDGDGKQDLAFIRIKKENVALCKKDSSLNWKVYDRSPEIDWDKAYSGEGYLKLVIIDHDNDRTDTNTFEKYLMNFADSDFQR